MIDKEKLKVESFEALGRAEIATLTLEVEVASWQPCGCCRIDEVPRRPGTPQSNLSWYKKRWHRTYCRVPGYEGQLPEKNFTATVYGAIAQFWDFLHASYLDGRMATKAKKPLAYIESEAEFKAAIERLRLRVQRARLPTTDLHRIMLHKKPYNLTTMKSQNKSKSVASKNPDEARSDLAVLSLRSGRTIKRPKRESMPSTPASNARIGWSMFGS